MKMAKTTKSKDTLQPALLVKTKKRRFKLKTALDVEKLKAKAKNDLLPQLDITRVPIAFLKPANKRVKKLTDAQVIALTKSIAALGFIGAVLVRGQTLVDGHARVEAMKLLKETRIPVIDVSHMTDTECAALMISMNRIAETGVWDVDATRDAIIELEVHGYDLELTGFTPIEIDTLKLDPIESAPGGLDELPDETPAGLITSQLGDLWQLGRHRLLCGSATNPADYTLLMNGAVATAIATDPPYNVKIAGNVSGLGKVKHGEFVMGSGEQSPEEFLQFLTDFHTVSRAHLIDGGVAFAFIDSKHIKDMNIAGEAAGYTLLTVAVWTKQAGMGSFYRSAHELVPVFCNGMTPAVNNIKLGVHGRDRSNVWPYPSANQKGSSANKMLQDHPTPKCVEMIVDMMLDVTGAKDVVLDPFIGSGTSIIAAEECDRAAYGIELDPKFVDLAIRRWEGVTGKTAVLAGTGQTFAEVTVERAALATGYVN